MKVSVLSCLLLCACFWLASCQLLSSDKVIYVNNALVPCREGDSERCLQIKIAEDGSWQAYSGTLEGFEYEKGYFYKLKVSENTTGHSAEGETSPSYTVVDILEKSKTTLTLDKGFWIVKGILETSKLPRNPVFKINQDTFEGNTSCNKFSGTIALDKDSFKPTIASVTEMECNTLSVEHLFLKTLPEVKRYQIKGDSLLLLDKHKKIMMTCVYSPE